MTNQEQLDILLRERNFALRRRRDPHRNPQWDRDNSWKALARALGKTRVQRLKHDLEKMVFDVGYPPPKTAEDQVLWDKNRSVKEIDRDMSKIPPPTIKFSVQDSIETVDFDTDYGAFLDCEQESVFMRHATPTDLTRSIRVHGHFDADQCSANLRIKKVQLVDNSADFVIQVETRKEPHRSRIYALETQNDDRSFPIPREGPKIDGRHFKCSIILSKQMMEAVLDCLPDLNQEHAYSGCRHMIAIGINHRLDERDLALSSTESFISVQGHLISKLYVAHVAKDSDELRIVRIAKIEEID